MSAIDDKCPTVIVDCEWIGLLRKRDAERLVGEVCCRDVRKRERGSSRNS